MFEQAGHLNEIDVMDKKILFGSPFIKEYVSMSLLDFSVYRDKVPLLRSNTNNISSPQKFLGAERQVYSRINEYLDEVIIEEHEIFNRSISLYLDKYGIREYGGIMKISNASDFFAFLLTQNAQIRAFGKGYYSSSELRIALGEYTKSPIGPVQSKYTISYYMK
ncbi:hypothetical protein BB558_006052 [Smittium angustum]|uniref:Uncharacterized protein n=1 Tax=Smittium angustum TaxID=133377 RepID=A0A2U1IYR6_SMIAN|nr:hypothetical protein BB558_006052 [Smittium angustum]